MAGPDSEIIVLWGLNLGTWQTVFAGVVAIVATGTLVLTWLNIRRSRLQARAATLLELDRRWDGDAFTKLRDLLWDFMGEVDKEANQQWGHLSPDDIRTKAEELFAERLKTMQQTESDKYRQLMRVVDFVETLGYVSQRKYLLKSDVINLFGGVVLSVGRIFIAHIRYLQALPGTTGRAWEYTIWLVEETRKIAAASTGCRGGISAAVLRVVWWRRG